MDELTFRRTADIAVDYLRTMPDSPIREDASLEELRESLRVPLRDEPLPPRQVIEELVAAVEPGVIDVQSPRYFGFVMGGGLDSAIAADWLTTAWDQNGGGYPAGPSGSVAEEVACEWLLELLDLPRDAGVGLTTGCQMAHFTCLAAARHRVLEDSGWDVEQDGLFGAPEVRVLVGAKAHTTVIAALRMLGLGSRRVELVPADDQGRLVTAELAQRLNGGEGPAIVIAQVGEVNTGAIDDMPEITRLARDYGAWCHVDGAFGLWAAASPKLRGLVEGVAGADSWATDGHKWLNVPYDSGAAIVRDRAAHAAAMNSFAGVEYIPQPEHGERYQSEWVPEFSRRARGFTVYAAIRELGRLGGGGPGRALLQPRPPDGRPPGGRGERDVAERRSPEPGASPLPRRRREHHGRGDGGGPARGDLLDERDPVGRRARHADLGLQLAHDRGRHPSLGGGDPGAGPGGRVARARTA